jgi:hypothetical protein
MTSMAVSATWHYKFEKHEVKYGAILFLVGIVIMGLAGHDIQILRGISTGEYDLTSLHDLYFNISGWTAINLIWDLGFAIILGSVVYMVLVGIAQRRIAKDRFPLA